jgi:hypothetical protein
MQKQRQKQLSKQYQLVDQGFSNTILLNSILAVENLAFFYGYKGKKYLIIILVMQIFVMKTPLLMQ